MDEIMDESDCAECGMRVVWNATRWTRLCGIRIIWIGEIMRNATDEIMHETDCAECYEMGMRRDWRDCAE